MLYSIVKEQGKLASFHNQRRGCRNLAAPVFKKRGTDPGNSCVGAGFVHHFGVKLYRSGKKERRKTEGDKSMYKL